MSTRVAYRADQAFDGDREIPGGALVLVEGARIVGVEQGGAPAPSDFSIRYDRGVTLLPGLIDAHTHLCGDSGPDALDRLPALTGAELDEAVGAALGAHLAAGVTAVRDLGDQQWAVVDRHRDRPGSPLVVPSGPPITVPDGHCAAMGGGARGTERLRRAVRERAERGAAVVKVMTTGGMMTPGTDMRARQFGDDELRAVVEEAHELGLPVTAHAHATAGVEQSVAAGVDGIEHCTCMGPDGMRTPPGLAAAIAAAGIVVCPTVGTTFGAAGTAPPPEVAARMARAGFSLDGRRAQVGELAAGGVSMISGTDSGINPAKPHGLLPHSIAELVACGVPAAAALGSATGLAADACGLAGRTGRLRAGLRADLLLVRGDPVRDVAALRAVHTVVLAGEVVG
ncbi:amidohydrolase family protein [Actinoplanes sp. NPDC051861]|uniref:amidohydrolase family protein n=1 Tax=Actinoplanes sp. NPDC051861 TaxID=3155170 RepID=UPI00341954D3